MYVAFKHLGLEVKQSWLQGLTVFLTSFVTKLLRSLKAQFLHLQNVDKRFYLTELSRDSENSNKMHGRG